MHSKKEPIVFAVWLCEERKEIKDNLGFKLRNSKNKDAVCKIGDLKQAWRGKDGDRLFGDVLVWGESQDSDGMSSRQFDK